MTAGVEAPADRPTSRLAAETLAYIELFALTGLVFTQPIFDYLRKNAVEVVVAQHPSPIEVLLVTAAILFLPALVLWGIELVVGLVSTRGRRFVHAAFAGTLVGLFVFAVLHRAEWPDVVNAVLGVAAGGGAAVLIVRFSIARTYLRFLAVAPIVFAVLFLTGPVVGPLITDNGGPAAATVVADSPGRIMMIVLDELPTRSLMDGSGHVDERLFPNFAALEQQSTWYRNATSVAPFTRVAVPAIVDGRYPTDPSAHEIAQYYPETIFTLLGRDFALNVHEASNEALCPQALCPKEGERAVSGIVGDAASAWTDQTFRELKRTGCACDDQGAGNAKPTAERFLRSIRPSTGPQLDYAHVLLPHAPWQFVASGQDYAPKSFIPPGLQLDGTWSTATAADAQRYRHLLQLQYVDRWLGDIVERLQQIGEYDSTTIVLTADHGVSFDGPVPYRVPVAKSYSDILWVPLFVKRADQTGGRVDDRPASTIDVMPTIADILDVRVPWPVDGRSLLGAPRKSQDVRFLRWPSRSPFDPPKEAVYREWDGPEGLARVLASPTVNPGVDGAIALYGRGRFGALVGRPAAPAVDEGTSGPDIRFDNSGALGSVDPSAPLVPWALLTGALSGRTQTDVAVAVNGTIVATGATEPSYGGEPYFSVPLPPERFKPGVNDVDVYVVAGTPASPRLLRTQEP